MGYAGVIQVKIEGKSGPLRGKKKQHMRVLRCHDPGKEWLKWRLALWLESRVCETFKFLSQQSWETK